MRQSVVLQSAALPCLLQSFLCIEYSSSTKAALSFAASSTHMLPSHAINVCSVSHYTRPEACVLEHCDLISPPHVQSETHVFN